MHHKPLPPSEAPIRLFNSDFLEFFTHISPITVMVIWLPVVAYLLILTLLDSPKRAFPWYIPVAFLVGLFVWTFSEYILHRFVFHYKARNAWQERATFIFHGIHHAQPQDKTRLVMPPVLSIPMALLFFGLFYLVLAIGFKAPLWVAPMFAAFMIGYLVYDLTHYATHHFAMRTGILKWLKRYHMQHHYKTPDQRFGVSSPLWDFIFGTYPD